MWGVFVGGIVIFGQLKGSEKSRKSNKLIKSIFIKIPVISYKPPPYSVYKVLISPLDIGASVLEFQQW